MNLMESQGQHSFYHAQARIPKISRSHSSDGSGALVEQGNHEQLMELDGRYATLFHQQARDTNNPNEPKK